MLVDWVGKAERALATLERIEALIRDELAELRERLERLERDGDGR